MSGAVRRSLAFAGALAGFALGWYIAWISVLHYLVRGDGALPILANAFADPFLLVHVVSASVALVVGPWQFVNALRRRRPAVHRAAGYAFIAATALSAPSGLMLALGSTAGPIAGSGFGALAIGLAATTCAGLRAAVCGRYQLHREWMIRAYALTAAAITLRLMLPASAVAGLDFVEAYRAVAWLSWLLNLAVAEIWIRRNRLRLRSAARPAPGTEARPAAAAI